MTSRTSGGSSGPGLSDKPPRRAGRRRRRKRRLNVLITGVTGGVGRHLAHRLYHDTRVGKVLGVAREKRPIYFDELDPERFVYYRTSILKYRELKDLFRSERFKDAQVDAVVHLAFINRPQGKDAYAHRLNVEGTKRLLDECGENPHIRKFIFKSSDVVYKLTPSGPVYLDENAPLNHDMAADQWIKDRVDADMICRARMDTPGLSVVVLRVSIIVGGHVGTALNSYFGSSTQLRALGFDPLINLVHISDVVQAIELSLFQEVKGIFNIGGGDTAPLATLAEAAGTQTIPVPTSLLKPANWLMRRLGISRYYYPVDRDRMRYSGLLDITKARRVLGYEPHSFLR